MGSRAGCESENRVTRLLILLPLVFATALVPAQTRNDALIAPAQALQLRTPYAGLPPGAPRRGLCQGDVLGGVRHGTRSRLCARQRRLLHRAVRRAREAREARDRSRRESSACHPAERGEANRALPR